MTLHASLTGTPAENDWVRLPGNPAFATVLDYADSGGKARVAPFEMSRRPVTNAQFLAFVTANPRWRRGAVPAVFAEARYLDHWRGPLQLGNDVRPQQPVTRISWFAARAYCEWQSARLPRWAEWEYAAAADGSRSDARADPAWRERILSWYAKPSTHALADVGTGSADVNGIHDLHGLVWEWVDDYAAMLVSSDNRQQGDKDILQFCGAGALSTKDRENYAVLMRIAMLSALEADDTTANLGFRCAREIPGATP
ncbi:formylglycine-generating enzyme family protein [Tahibacter amnicola]|uniref:Formylglycine-generating enzyme family protein n=1 Tax=Tahibacter amnicola TaxID=2976241 RepID=A0ABY6BE27_9GAMM|nr:formylglycine-generating enzyme family protein [Tahibacter amnicola]UXI66580.1 formylglycine-generating enzyme family protein [Tahibacter amnicola]